MESKDCVVLNWKDINDLEKEVLKDIELTDASYYHGMLEVIRWIKVNNVKESKIIK